MAGMVAGLAAASDASARLVEGSALHQRAASRTRIIKTVGAIKMDRVLIVNADDFGQNAAITQGIRRAHKQGIVTSTSLMVHWPTSAEAAEHSDGLDLGLHIDLGEWRYCDGSWSALYQRVEPTDTSAIHDEIHFQLSEFRRLTGKSPSHLDSHQHVHIHEPVLSIAKHIAEDLDIPLRG